MDGELLRWLYHRLLHDPTLTCGRRRTFGDGLVAFIYFFAVLSGRSPRQASQRRNWPIWCCAILPKKLISYSQLNRRLKTLSLQQLISQLEHELRLGLPCSCEKAVDGKPLIVGGFSHDPDASWGKVPDGWAKGYKLHVVIDGGCGAIEAWELTPLNSAEAVVLRQKLLGRLDLSGCVLRGDANYDSNPTYHDVAELRGRHIAPRRKPGRGLGQHLQHPHRLQAIEELEQTAGGKANHKRRRNRVEQVLAHLCNLPFGLSALPGFVRRLSRVRLWVAAKITLYHLHLTQTLLAHQTAA